MYTAHYQLQRYLTFGKNYCAFICANCVEIPEYLRKISLREPNEVLQEKHEKELERSCNLKKEIATLKETIRNKENEHDELRSKLYTEANAEETPSNLNKKKQEKRRIGESTNSEKEVKMMHKSGGKKDLEIKQLKE